MKCDNPECACNKDTSLQEEQSTVEDIQTQSIEGAEQAIDSLMHIAASGSEASAVAASEVLIDFFWLVHGEC